MDLGEYLNHLYYLTYMSKLGIAVAFLGTAFFIIVLKPVSIRIGLVDTPNHRKNHIGNIPLVGGVAMFLGFLFSFLTLQGELSIYKSFIACAGLLIIIGVLDDFKELTAFNKFIAQFTAILFMIYWGDVRVWWIGSLMPGQNPFLGVFSLPFTFIAAIAVINAVNMSDGIDGLAGGYTLIALTSMLILAVATASDTQIKVLLLLVFMVAGFLIFNLSIPYRKNAFVFMGDAGSMFLGFVLVWFSISLSQGPERSMNPVIALWLLALPLFDMVGVTLRRFIRRKSVFSADREHFHHFFELAGYSRQNTAYILLLFSALFAIIGMCGHYFEVNDSYMFGAFVLLFAVYFISMFRAWNGMKKLEDKSN